MEILKSQLRLSIGMAEQYRLIGKNDPEGLNVHTEHIKSMMKPLIGSSRCQQTAAEEAENIKLLEDAKRTLKNLATENRVEGPAILKVREKLEILSGQKLPSFDGSVAKFREFMSSFSTLFSLDPSFSDAEKLIMLKSCLIGEAFNFVDAFPTSPTNYSLALKLLEDIYGGGSSDVTKLYQRLNELPQVSMNDGAKFRETYRQLESILQSMGKCGVDVNEDLCLRFLYLRRFTERTLVAVLIKDSDMSLPEIRREIRHLINVDELHLEPAHVADTAENRSVSGDRLVVSQRSSNQSTINDCQDRVSTTALNRKKTELTVRVPQIKTESSTPKPIQSMKQNSVKKSKRGDEFEWSLATVLTDAIYEETDKKTSVRLLFQDDVKISLMTEDAARRLGISIPKKKTLRLCTSDVSFTATEEYFSILITANEWESEDIHVHIVDNSFSSLAQKVPGVDIDDFKKENPRLRRFNWRDTGRGRPIDIFVCGCFKGFPFSASKLAKPNWQVDNTFYGLVVQGLVKKIDPRVSYSYRFADDYAVPYSKLYCKHG